MTNLEFQIKLLGAIFFVAAMVMLGGQLETFSLGEVPSPRLVSVLGGQATDTSPIACKPCAARADLALQASA